MDRRDTDRAGNDLGESVENNFQFKEEKRYIKVSRETRWEKGWKQKEILSIRMVKNKPKNPTWNDLYFPIVLKIPMFYEHQSTEIEVPPRPAGRVALDLLNPKDKNAKN